MRGRSRPAAGVLALFDSGWGSTTDSATAAVEVSIREPNPGWVEVVDTARSGVSVPRDGLVLVAGAGASLVARRAPARGRAGRPDSGGDTLAIVRRCRD